MNATRTETHLSPCATWVPGASRLLAEAADWAALTPERAEQMLAALEQVASFRSKENYARLGVDGFAPTPERPLIIVVVDECHAIWATRELAMRWLNVLRIARKIGISVWAASQFAELQQTFAGLSGLRDLLCQRTAVALYSPTRNSKFLIPGIDDELDLSSLPKAMPGYGYLCTPQRDETGTSVGTRVAPMRFDYLDTSEPNEDTVRALFSRHPSVPLDPVAEIAAKKPSAMLTHTVTRSRPTNTQPTS